VSESCIKLTEAWAGSQFLYINKMHPENLLSYLTFKAWPMVVNDVQ